MLGSGETPVTSPRATPGPTMSTGKKTVASNLPAGSPGEDGRFEACLKRLLGDTDGTSERVECYMSLLSASRSVPEEDVPALFSLSDFPALLSTMSSDIQKDGQPDV